MTNDDIETKTFEGYFIVNWEHERMRHRKTELDDVALAEVAIR